MPKYSRRSRRKQVTGTTEKPVKGPSSYQASSPPPAARSTATKAVTYDAQKYIGNDIKYSLLVGGLVIALLVIAYVVFR